jgi:hypothetical protein
VNESAAAALAARDEQIEILLEDVGNLERDLRGKRARIKLLQKDQDARLRNHPNYDQAVVVLGHWQRHVSPSAREPVNPKRLEPCLARLAGGYTVDELCLACDGYALKPYVVNGKRTHDGPKDSWRADAELIFRDPQHVDAGLRIAERADDLRSAMTPSSETVSPMRLTSVGPATTLSPLGEAARRLARFGFYVFPCAQRQKVPATRNGLKDAKRDDEAITTCWQQYPHMNIGVRTGAESGIVVLDVDGDEGWDSLHELEDQFDELPSTASVTTPRGGQHFYFVHPGFELRNTTGFPGPGLDVRGDGGYVLAPPSVAAGGRAYQVDEEVAPVPLPAWLLKLLVDYQRKSGQALQGATDWAQFVTQGASQGERDNRMTKYVGHLYRHELDAREVFALAQVLNAQVKPPLSDKDLTRIVQSIGRAEARKA